MEAAVEDIGAKLDEVIRRLDHLEMLLLMGEVFPDNEEMKAIKDYLLRAGRGETEFIPLEEIDNEL
ncbi:hypothetical protein ANME2D_03151 [Candidatus Methanoperedens nitroreducens]|uniref:Uncharacterized protein n=2 Tax=Candidatus Methanoperedens nitratireducens TaxID=1392998 RepID=A0A062V5N8_9EURY|nr:hypothetical protein ANME2D_03151 [Candidatus Methanoperedens nitroreducens]